VASRDVATERGQELRIVVDYQDASPCCPSHGPPNLAGSR
jgi:hypothetical protein